MEYVLRTAVEEVLEKLKIIEVAFTIEHPVDLSHGDYACNVAMAAAKSVGENPRVLAEKIKDMLSDQIEYVDRIEVAGPGFLNFYLARDFFSAEIVRAQTEGDSWGNNNLFAGKKVIVEYTDPNPFKEFHVGHLFTNTVGESITRLFAASGADTKRANYQGDVGMHVANAIWGMQQLGLTPDTEFSARELGAAYAQGATAYKENETVAAEIKELNKKIYDRTDEVVNALYDKGRLVSLAYFEEVYAKLGTKFDAYFFESEAGPRGRELVLSHPEIFPESDGARVFKGEEHGLHTRVFVNSEGLPTYEAKELAVAKLKEEKLGTYDLSVISTSNEITEYFKVLLKAMSFLYPELAEKTEHIGHGTVRLATGKMSSRTGNVIAAVDFIDEIKHAVQEKMRLSGHVPETDEGALATDIAVAAIKYATLKSNILQDSTFNTEQALSFEGDSGPYLQYTHARIVSVLDKAKSVNVPTTVLSIPEHLYEIERILYRFPEVIEDAVLERAPHMVASFLIELAGAFNTFYAQEKIADPSDQSASYKVMIADVVRQTLRNGLWILGIKAPLKM